MKICIVNGSPRGEYSVTLHSCLFLEKLYPNYQFDYLNVGVKIKGLERDFSEARLKLQEADFIIFSYPVYTFIAPSQLHRFIELIKENNINLKGKFASQITTSKHFYDITAHNYIEDNCHDLEMKYVKGLSQDMEDLTKESGQEDLKKFFDYLMYCFENNLYENKKALITKFEDYHYNKCLEIEKDNSKKIVIVTDLDKNDQHQDSLYNMINHFVDLVKYQVEIVNLREFPFKGGCLGCFNCAGNGKCVYKDNFDEFLRNNIQTANGIVIAFNIKDHSMGSLFKMYDDRQFCNGHRTVTEGLPFGYLINGSYESESNLKMIVEARAEVGHNFLAGVGYNEETIKAMTERLVYAMENKYLQPRNFYGIGGMKIFRDLIWIMRGLMKADHNFYKKHGVYDFPQKQRGKMILMCFLGAMVRNPKIKAKMGNKFNEGMVAPYKKVLKKLEVKKNK